ncbi:hypothetical protein JW826_04660 [Candidatus Woesearchaeota archaeon]|nr:hypothetical protein [Candidatus Woesearchaeota archaeon]
MMFGFVKGFADEEELEAWFSEEKEKLDESFSAAIIKDREHIPLERDQYTKSLEALLERYKSEYSRILESQSRADSSAAIKKKHDELWDKKKAAYRAQLQEIWEKIEEEVEDDRKKYGAILGKMISRYRLECAKLVKRVTGKKRR